MRGCLVVMVVGAAVVGVFAADLYERHQHPALDSTPERINPNTAPIGSLVRLEGIGRARAMDIIHFRHTHQQEGPAFRSVSDLQQIRGIGPKTVETISPWLTVGEN